jgi:hypothetical protein
MTIMSSSVVGWQIALWVHGCCLPWWFHQCRCSGACWCTPCMDFDALLWHQIWCAAQHMVACGTIATTATGVYGPTLFAGVQVAVSPVSLRPPSHLSTPTNRLGPFLGSKKAGMPGSWVGWFPALSLRSQLFPAEIGYRCRIFTP